MFEPTHELIPSGEWSAAAVAQTDTDTYLAVEDFFAAEVDYQALFNGVLDHRQVDLPVAIRALDDVLGEIPAAAPFAGDDEDGLA
ncbi:hypothetical protein OIA45_48600 (plasmid) [Streptomyces chartreusis]|uniref:hypothetical protein n=1 Tax=Streptomyces chartreusis TaxID=1969 RepID=UPI0037DC14DB|nr:hypothetical protein OIA45_48600 [Streptomyces chartreusis]